MDTKELYQFGTVEKPAQVPIPKGRRLFTAVGPGLVLAMTFLGTGDLVSSSVSGANYGYALIWTLLISLVARGYIISSIAKYTLQNRFGDTQILEGYGRIFKWLPGIMALIVMISGFVTQSTFLKGCAVGLYNLTGGNWGGEWGPFICAFMIMCLTIYMILNKKQFKILEYIARIASIIMIVSFIIAMFNIGSFDIAAFIKGCLFEMPKDSTGYFGPLVVACATIGTIAGNMPNLLYSGFLRDKGWIGPRYRKLQQFDLAMGMAPLFIINILFWMVAAETAHKTGFVINNEYDLARLMETIMGPIGPFVLWLSIFCACFTSFPAEVRGFGQLAINGLHIARYGHENNKYKGHDEDDPLFLKIALVVFTILPIVASLPDAPSLVALNLVGTSLSTCISLPFIIVGLIILTSSKKYMADYAVNAKWQTVILIILGIIAIVVAIQIMGNLPDMFKTAFMK